MASSRLPPSVATEDTVDHRLRVSASGCIGRTVLAIATRVKRSSVSVTFPLSARLSAFAPSSCGTGRVSISMATFFRLARRRWSRQV